MSGTETTRSIRLKSGETAEIPESHVLKVADGLLGFADLENYALVPHGDESPFLWFQSLDEPALAFLTIDPRLFLSDYMPVVAEDELAAIGLKDVREAILLSIVVVPEDPRKMTTNLMGPILVNPHTRQARQVISQSPKHKIRHPILGETKGGE